MIQEVWDRRVSKDEDAEDAGTHEKRGGLGRAKWVPEDLPVS